MTQISAFKALAGLHPKVDELHSALIEVRAQILRIKAPGSDDVAAYLTGMISDMNEIQDQLRQARRAEVAHRRGSK